MRGSTVQPVIGTCTQCLVYISAQQPTGVMNPQPVKISQLVHLIPSWLTLLQKNKLVVQAQTHIKGFGVTAQPTHNMQDTTCPVPT